MENTTGTGTSIRRPVLGPVLVGAFAFLVSFSGSWLAPANIDEAATMSAARRSLPELWRMAHNVDGVHSTYYAFVHLWLRVVPYDFALLRLPSALAVGVGAALLVLLVRHLADPRAAIVAGLVFAVLPRTTSSGLQGRSYAFALLTAVAVALVFVIATERTTAGRKHAWAWWLGYSLLAALGAYVFLYSALLVVAQGVTVLVWQVTRRRRGRTFRAGLWWLGSAIVAAALVIPLVLMTSGQASKQLYWIGRTLRLDSGLAWNVLVQQNFGTSSVLAIVCGALVLLGVVAVSTIASLRDRSPALEVALPAVVVPPLAVIVVSVVVQPYYNARYLTFCAPFVAVLVALGITAFRWRATAVVGVLLVVALCVPSVVQQRWPTGKTGTHWVQVSDYLSAERARLPHSGIDGIYFGPLPDHPIRTTEYVASSYPDAFAGMRDLTLVRSGASIGELWADRLRPDQMPPTEGVDRIWYVGWETAEQPAKMRSVLEANGWRQETQKRITDFDVVSFVRD